MTRIAVTGGSGASGRRIVSALQAAGHAVINIDRRVLPAMNVPAREVDLSDYGQVFSALHGAEAVVHFGAHPEPDWDHQTGADRFNNNTAGCFNVFNAAAALGINRIAWASSETVLGFPFETNAPIELPITEDTPVQPQNAYAISKALSEDLARHVCRLNPSMTIIGLRLSNILYEADHRDLYSKLPTYWPDKKARRFNLWSYIDAEDVCDAVLAALAVDMVGAHDFIIAADDTVMACSSAELIAGEFPALSLPDAHPDRGALISNQKAGRVLGWQPKRRWADYL